MYTWVGLRRDLGNGSLRKKMVMCRIMTQCGTAGNCNLKKSHPPNLTSSKNLKQLTANSSIAEI